MANGIPTNQAMLGTGQMSPQNSAIYNSLNPQTKPTSPLSFQTGDVGVGMTPGQIAGMNVATTGLRTANSIISTLLMLSENEKARKLKREETANNLALGRKSMMLEYLLGNKNYADKLRVITAKLVSSEKSRGQRQRSFSEQRKARTVR